MQDNITIALDRSVRRIDDDGHLFVDRCIVSAAVVSPYYGREIPGSKALGLDDNTLYWLYRDADELAKAASSMNGKPLIEIHQPVSADDHPREITVGSVNNCSFEAPNLIGQLSVWDGDAIKRIEDGTKKSVSAGYAYRAVPESGSINGQPYTLKMVDIRFNHLALVEKPRVTTAIIGDSALTLPHNEEIEMAIKSRNDNARSASALAEAIKSGKIGMDSTPDDILKVMGLDEDPDNKKKAEDEEDKDKKSEDEDDKKAEDEEPTKKAEDDDDGAEDEEEDDKKKGAQDRAINVKMAVDSAVQAAITAERQRHSAAMVARTAVRPLVGEVIGMDSAEDIYRYALKEAGVMAQDTHPSALPVMLDLVLQQRMPKRPVATHAMDAADDFSTRFGVTMLPKKL
ncbi:DUF2213 domain-containing protein [Swingsia samuiensis]|uniref:DUF2213 domain-containing protein n=1 Tax=Swingsia samuiensis TaxID=1293412 RepID=UPI001FE591A0|nr:DUF2213 domain-containing protein [Swingsia samuiensis]